MFIPQIPTFCSKLLELPNVFGHIGGFVLEPFGSFVTDLGLPRESGRSDLDVVMLFRHHRADSKENDVSRRPARPWVVTNDGAGK
eukprot:symbB.v1.2.017918.t1/scaffold1409.1/size120616/3